MAAPEELLPLLHETAERAGLRVRRERARSGPEDAPVRAGVCTVKGRLVLVLFPGLSIDEECRLYVQALRRMDLAGAFLVPAVREALEGG